MGARNASRRGWLELRPAGMNSDVSPYALAPEVWTLAKNVRFSGGSAQRVGGYAQALGAPLFAPDFLLPTLRGDESWLLYAGAAGVAVTRGGAHTNVTPAGWVPQQAGLYTGCTFANVPIFTGPTMSAPLYWDGTEAAGSVKPLPGWLADTSARLIRAFKSHLFAGDLMTATGRQPDALAWSDAAPAGSVPGSWTPTASNQAGRLYLSDAPGAIVDARPLAEFLMVYKQGGAWAVSYVGRPYIYAARRVSSAAGCVSPNAIAEVRGQHVLLGAGDIVRTDGFQTVSLVDQRMRSAIFNALNSEQLGLAHAVHHPGKSEVWFLLPVDDSARCKLAAVWNYTADTWALRDVPDGATSTVVIASGIVDTAPAWDEQGDATWDDASTSWGNVSYGDPVITLASAMPDATLIARHDYGDTFNGRPIEVRVQRLSAPIAGTDGVKLVTRVIPRLSGSPGSVVTVRAGVQMGVSDPILWGAPVAVTLGGDPPEAQLFAQGRFISVEVASTALAPVSVDGIAVEYLIRGRY